MRKTGIKKGYDGFQNCFHIHLNTDKSKRAFCTQINVILAQNIINLAFSYDFDYFNNINV
jgi:hypothetical protein